MANQEIRGKITRPFRRTVRPFGDGSYRGSLDYIRHRKYAVDPAHYVRAYKLIQKDVEILFDFIEPSSLNLQCYSFRVHEILMRTCIEIEANFKAILKENGYKRDGNWNIKDYKKVENSHSLSKYSVQLPIWRDGALELKPFAGWMDSDSQVWYRAYNSSKHDRHNSFPDANLHNLLNSVGALVILISSQFRQEDFTNKNVFGIISNMPDGYEDAIGGLFRVKYPGDIPLDQRYEFSWSELQNYDDPFSNFSF